MGNFDRRDSRRSSDRDDRRGGSGNFNRGFSNPRQKHKAKCTECGSECEVPFKPTEGRDVFCDDCFKKQRRD